MRRIWTSKRTVPLHFLKRALIAVTTKNWHSFWISMRRHCRTGRRSGANFEYDSKAFNARVESAQAPAIQGTIRIYNAAQRLAVRVFFLTGRPEAQRASTESNLRLQGFSKWEQLILRKPEQAKMTALAYKSGERAKIAVADIGSSSTLAISGAICAASRRRNCQ